MYITAPPVNYSILCLSSTVHIVAFVNLLLNGGGGGDRSQALATTLPSTEADSDNILQSLLCNLFNRIYVYFKSNFA